MNPHDKILERFWAGGFLFDPDRKAIFLHQRDGNTKINPHKWAFFGGLNEPKETFFECFKRELSEEIGLIVNKGDTQFLVDYLNEELSTHRVVFFVETNISEKRLTLGEGAGFAWVKLVDLATIDMTEKTRIDIDTFLKVKHYLGKYR